MELQNVLPADIEKRSMEIIAEELGEIQLDPEKVSIVKRVIHTSADFDYADCFRYVHGDNGYYLDCNSDSDSDYYSVRN